MEKPKTVGLLMLTKLGWGVETTSNPVKVKGGETGSQENAANSLLETGGNPIIRLEKEGGGGFSKRRLTEDVGGLSGNIGEKSAGGLGLVNDKKRGSNDHRNGVQKRVLQN